MEQTYNEHMTRINYLKSKNIKINEIWECEWDNLVESNLELKAFLKKQSIREPLNPRDALFGGRTNAAKLYHEIKGDEQILHYD